MYNERNELHLKEGIVVNKTIIVPVDGSQSANKALQFAITMAKAYGDNIRVVNVQSSATALGEPIIQEAATALEQAGMPYSTKIRIGTPSIEIFSEANDEQVRAIVMGLKGAGNSNKKLGSVSQATLSLVPCPITLVP